MKYYTGIGSRKTPMEILRFISKVSKYLMNRKYTLRSGHAPGADLAFERPVEHSVYKQIFIPWPNFGGSISKYDFVSEKALEIAKKYHPRWNELSLSAKLLIARNSFQILGPRLNEPSDFVICYTLNGEYSGGTGQALRIADDYDIPIYNLFYDEIRKGIFRLINKHINQKTLEDFKK